LFADLPARRATLRSPAVETAHIVVIVRDYALCHASVRFTLLSDDHVLLATSGTGVHGAIVEIYGADLGHALVEVPAQRVGAARISGWVASRAFTQRTTRHIVLCANGRPVTNGTLVACVQAGYRPLLRKGRHPIALLTIDMDPRDVDASVHPAKRQVLLRDERAIGAALRNAVRTALATRAAESPPPLTSLTHTYQHVRQAAFPLRRPRRAMHEPRPLFVTHRTQSSPESLSSAFSAMSSLTALGQLDNCLIVAQSDAGDLLLIDQHRAHERLLHDALCRQSSLLHTPAAPLATHDAKRVTGGGQLLLEPLVVELSPRQAQLLTSRLTELASLGLVCEPFGGATFLVRALPPVPEGVLPVSAFASELTADAAEDADDWLEHLRASLACRAALRRGQMLSPEEQRALLVALSQTDVPAVCPHGSPIVVRWGRDQLARTFEW
jgi:DNA mismatch repair protein MutL